MYVQVRSERKAGNLARARKASRSAYVWARRASVVGMIFYIIGLILFIIGALTGAGFCIYCIIACVQFCADGLDFEINNSE